MPWKTKCTSPRKKEFELGGISWEGLPLSERGFYLGTPKPMLRPMSSLTKPIVVDGYNEGNPFVPIDEILKTKGFKHFEFKESPFGGLGLEICGMWKTDTKYWPESLNDLLRSWHLNVDGIPEHLYVKIED